MANPEQTEQRFPRFGEFVTMIAACMAMTALSIDSMLPSLGSIGEGLGVSNPNSRQWVISAFMISFGIGQIVHGPLSDRFGRRPVLRINLLLVAVFNLLAAIAGSFTLLICARVACGLTVSACRVLAVSVVRDRFAGREMARVMSLAMIVFMAAPILAPSVGQLILLVAPWRWIFAALAGISLALLAWVSLRLPETLPPERRLPLSVNRIARGWVTTLTDRNSIGYTLALALLSGGLYGFINSVPQIFADIFRQPLLMTPVFACVAGTMALASLINSRLVVKLGTRRISHSALICFIGFAILHLVVGLTGMDTLLSFAVVQALMMGSFGLASANFGAMAMEKMGALAGTAASVQGFLSTVIGALIGVAIGQSFNGTTVPLYTGFLLSGVAALVVVMITERGKLFRPQMA
jgi:DHA1 family bicyclomycin/chloramphenicol resistance-like MFS transporter